MFQHHKEGSRPEFKKLFEDEILARERLNDQLAGRARRSWSDGRLGVTDDGDIAFAVGPHPDRELVVIDFGKPVESIAMPPQQAIELAQSLITHARAITTTAITLEIK